MPYQDQKLFISATRGLSLGDIATVLYEGTEDLGRLCTSEHIKLWAKYKPVRYSSKLYVGPTVRSNQRYGVNIPFFYKLSEFVAAYPENIDDSTLNGWGYLPPRGLASNEPFRMADFIKTTETGGYTAGEYGYDHKAVRIPFGKFVCTSDNITVNGGVLAIANEWLTPVGGWEDTNLAISDFGTFLLGRYYGFVAKPDASGYPWLLYSDSTTIGVDGQGASVARCFERLRVSKTLGEQGDAGAFSPGGYTIYPALFNQGGLSTSINSSSASSTLPDGLNLITIPDAWPVHVFVLSELIAVIITAPRATLQQNGTYTISFRWYVVNQSTYDYSIVGDKAMLRLSQGAYNESTIVPGFGESSTDISGVSFTVTAGHNSPQYQFTKTGVVNSNIQRVWVGVTATNQSTQATVGYRAHADGIMYPTEDEVPVNEDTL